MLRHSKTPGRTIGGADGYRQLAAAILHQGLHDWWAVSAGRALKNQQEVALTLGYGKDCAREVCDFFDSDWLDNLCLACGVDLTAYLAAARRGPLGGAQ